MKTIAVSIDEASLAAIDRMARLGGRGTSRKGRANRSELVRRAVQEFVERQHKREREENDRRILAAHRGQIDRQVSALVAEQADV
jgi:metal-responsive CopG/Arc/MetJ family transcriptional regulator